MLMHRLLTLGAERHPDRPAFHWVDRTYEWDLVNALGSEAEVTKRKIACCFKCIVVASPTLSKGEVGFTCIGTAVSDQAHV